MKAEIDDIVLIGYPFLRKRCWKVINVLPDVNRRSLLYTLQLVSEDGVVRELFHPIIVTDSMVTDNLGNYESWKLNMLKVH